MNPVVNPMPMPFDPREAVVISIKTKANDTLVIKTDSILGILYIPQEDYLKLYISDSPMPGAVRDMESGLPLITLRGVERAEAERVMDLYTKWHSRFIMGVLSPYPVRVADAE